MKHTALLVIAGIGVVAIAFFTGTHAARRFALVGGWRLNQAASAQPGWGKEFRGGMMMGRGAFGNDGRGGYRKGGLQGQITKIDGNILTLQLPSGGTYTVTLNEETSVNKISKATNTDLAIGQTISVMGNGFWNGNQTIFIQP